MPVGGLLVGVRRAKHAGLIEVVRDQLESDRPRNLDADELEQYNVLLEEQAFPFEEKAIGIHEKNVKRAGQGTWDTWVEKSFADLAARPLELALPARQSSPLILASPHSGRIYPDEFARQSCLGEIVLRQSEDCFVDQLVGAGFPIGWRKIR